MQNCSSYLDKEIQYLQDVRVIVCLGKIAFDAVCGILGIKKAKFTHGNVIKTENYAVLCSYHPSRQNTQTGRLQWDQWNSIFVLVKKLAKDTRN
jgi:uracil-DNA glycosylase